MISECFCFWRDPSEHRPLTSDVYVLWNCSCATEYLGPPMSARPVPSCLVASFLTGKAFGHSESRNASHRSLQDLSLWVRCLSSVLHCWLCLPLLEPMPSQTVHVCLLLIPLLDQELLSVFAECLLFAPRSFLHYVRPRSLPFVVNNFLPCPPSSSLVSTGDGRKGGKEGQGIFLRHPPCKVASRWVCHSLQVSREHFDKSVSSELE